jgi:hypothetical protein
MRPAGLDVDRTDRVMYITVSDGVESDGKPGVLRWMRKNTSHPGVWCRWQPAIR